MTKNAFITGIAGQDGSYLSELLLKKKYKVFGLDRMGAFNNKISSKINLLRGDLGDHESLKKALKESLPDEIYNLGGISHLKTANENLSKTLQINYKSVEVLVNEALKINRNVRFLQASSSEIFIPSETPLDENSMRDIRSSNPYTIAKIKADDFIMNKRRSENAFLCSAIFFNHESPRRPEIFVSRKISRTLAKIKLGLADCLYIGNLDVYKDWGFSGDYVKAIFQMLQLDKAEDFVIATGEIHSIRDMISIACEILEIEITWMGKGVDSIGLSKNGRAIVKVDSTFYKPSDDYPKIGNTDKAIKMLNWQPMTKFRQLIQMMVESDLNELILNNKK